MKQSQLAIVNVGNFVDFLEFSLFSSLMPLISRDVLGGTGSLESATLAYFLFFVGFMGRPVGAAALGHLGDKIGRRKTLVICILGMSVATFALSLVPPCAIAGLLVGGARFFQGMFTGGEYANATVHVIEVQASDRGLRNAANLTASGIFGASIGQIIGTLVASGMLPMLTWRHAFAGVALISLMVALSRRFLLPEPVAVPQQDHEKVEERPRLFYWHFIFQGIVLGGLMNGIFYFIYTFLGTFISLSSGKIVLESYLLSLLSSVLFGGALLVFSRSVRFSRTDPTRLLRVSLGGMLLLIYPMYAALTHQVFSIYSMVLLLAFIGCTQVLTLLTLTHYPKQFPRHCRVFYSGTAISLGNSIIGGSSPYVSSKLVMLTGNASTPIAYFILLIILSFLVITFWPLGQKKEGCYELGYSTY